MPPTHLPGRILSLLFATACGFVVREVWQHATDADRPSAGLAATAVAAVLAGAALLVCALAPSDGWQRAVDSLHSVRRRMASAPPANHRTAGWILIGLAMTGFAALLIRFYPLQQNPWDDDQGAFLLTASDIHDAGGLGWLLPALFRGEFAEANRHPLYLALLSFHPTFAGGKFLSLGIAVVTLVLLTAMTARRIGLLGAGVFCALLATNYEFCFHATRVVCEVLIVLLSGALWLWYVPVCAKDDGNSRVVGSLRDPDPGNSTGHGVTGLYSATLAGALLGLLYLTKGTGLLLLGGYLLWFVTAWLRHTPDLPDTASTASSMKKLAISVGSIVAAFVLISSPLLIRNVRCFDSPFYNINSLLLFADRYEEINQFLADGTTTREAARQFLEHHSIIDILRREVSGLVWETFIMLRSLGPTPLDDSRVLLGLPLAGIAALTMLSRRCAADGLLLVWGVILWIMFAWYVPIAASERFILPLLVPLLYLASEGIVRAIGALRPAVGILLPWIAAAWVAVWVALTYLSDGLASRLG